MKASRPQPRSRGRQPAATPTAKGNPRRPASAAAALREEPTPYRGAADGQPPASSQAAPRPREQGCSAGTPLRFIDLFCGIGGFRLAFERAGCECVFSSDWDKHSQATYAANFGETPHGDIRAVNEAQIPPFDILCAGFPCQPFNIAGVSK